MPSTVDMVVSSETEMPGFFGPLVLSHKRGAVNLRRVSSRSRMAFLADHDGTRPIGKILKVTLRDRRLEAVAELVSTPRSDPYLAEIDGGLRWGISPGFIVVEAELVEMDNGEIMTLITAWEPYECSSTPVPRNPDAGIISITDKGAASVQVSRAGSAITPARRRQPPRRSPRSSGAAADPKQIKSTMIEIGELKQRQASLQVEQEAHINQIRKEQGMPEEQGTIDPRLVVRAAIHGTKIPDGVTVQGSAGQRCSFPWPSICPNTSESGGPR